MYYKNFITYIYKMPVYIQYKRMCTDLIINGNFLNCTRLLIFLRYLAKYKDLKAFFFYGFFFFKIILAFGSLILKVAYLLILKVIFSML